MVDRYKPKHTTKFLLKTSAGLLNEVKFCDFDDDPEKGREKAHNAALRLKDNWVRNAPHYLPDDQRVEIIEQ